MEDLIVKHYESLHDGDLSKIGLQPKLCPAGYWTIGYGRVVNDPKTNRPLKGALDSKRALELYPSLTIAEAEKMLSEDLARFRSIVKGLLNPKINFNMNQVGALVSLSYNIGQGSFAQSSLLRALNKGNYSEAAERFMEWNKANVSGKLTALPGLTARRKTEQQFFLTGTIQFFN